MSGTGIFFIGVWFDSHTVAFHFSDWNGKNCTHLSLHSCHSFLIHSFQPGHVKYRQNVANVVCRIICTTRVKCSWSHSVYHVKKEVLLSQNPLHFCKILPAHYCCCFWGLFTWKWNDLVIMYFLKREMSAANL